MRAKRAVPARRPRRADCRPALAAQALPGAAVTVVAEAWDDTTSHGAGGLWKPYTLVGAGWLVVLGGGRWVVGGGGPHTGEAGRGGGRRRGR